MVIRILPALDLSIEICRDERQVLDFKKLLVRDELTTERIHLNKVPRGFDPIALEFTDGLPGISAYPRENGNHPGAFP
jgi:hypothetical protein